MTAAGLVVTLAGIGHLRPAPGTWASVATVALAALAFQAGGALFVPAAFAVVTVAGFALVPRYLARRTDPDPSEVVIDEAAGQLLALCFTFLPLWWRGVSDLTAAWPAWLVPFLLFRLFDIWKPWLVGRADRRGDAAGVMLDDLWAGLFAGLASVALAALYHGARAAWVG